MFCNHAKIALDMDGALARLRGDRGLLQDLIGFFIADWPALRAGMSQALDAHDGPTLERLAYSAKGLAANFGAEIVVLAAQRVEVTARYGGWGELIDLLSKVIRLGDLLSDQLADLKDP